VALTAGTRLGPYEITAQIGVGGMGEVYRATDTSLGRQVAIKVLPEAFAQDAERLARFEREAKTLAALNHPHIAQIYGLERSSGMPALVLELVEGKDLSQRIARGLIPIDEALPIAKQIAEALEAAHEQGIIHRDLKPANIKLRSDGVVKVLDFGLAKLLETDPSVPRSSGAAAAVTNSPTITTPAVTMAGVILGTAAYMSPEQARGEAVDHQADIWAFGCVLFEMLSGRRPFDGRTVSDVMAAVLRGEPEWTAVPRDLHPRIRLMLERCLDKEPTNRYHSIADARVDVQKAAADPSAGTMDSSTLRAQAHRTLLGLLVAAVVAGGAAGAAVWALKPAGTPRLERFAHVLPPGESFSRTGSGMVAISPDGASIVYTANGSLFLRLIDRVDAQAITGTNGDPTNPFFSPDGRSIGYQDFRVGELRRIAVSGGRPVTLAPVTNLFGATWSSDDKIVFGQENGIWRISASGGTPELLVRIAPGERVHAPQLLPGGKSLLFTLRTEVGSRAWEDARLVVQSLENGERRVIATGRDGRYLPTGHLVYGLKSVLFAVPFDIDGRLTRGAAVPLVEGVREPTLFPGTTGTANYDVSATGTLVYVAAEADTPIERELVMVDRRGNAKPILSEKRDYWRPRLSPNGSRIVVEVAEQGSEQLWIVDLKDGATYALTSGATGNVFATWSPNGESVIYRSNRREGYGIYRQALDGRGGPQLITSIASDVMPGDVSRDGVLVFAAGEQTGSRAIFTLPIVGGQPSAFLETPALEHMPTFAPDGHWIAYASNESGRSEVYIRSYPAREQTVRRVSQNGGTAPVWSRDGSELFYRSAAGNLMVVPVRLGAGISVGRAEQLFQTEGRFRISGNAPAYDVDASGRFIMVTQPDQRLFAKQINIVQNWTEELKRLAPTK
jgi:eukaryotic-like serine/threonine-protein kinase